MEFFYVILAIYIVGLGLGVAFACAEVNGLNTSDLAKVIFWPITVSIFLIGVILWLLIKLFKGILSCFDNIKDFFINVFCSAIKDKD